MAKVLDRLAAETLTLRIDTQTLKELEGAARVSGKTRSRFVREVLQGYAQFLTSGRGPVKEDS